MASLSPTKVLARVSDRLDPHLLAEGFHRARAPRTDEVRWHKPPDDAPGDELDRVAIRVAPCDRTDDDGRDGVAIRGWAWSWTRVAPVNLRLLAIEHREPGAALPSGWLCTSDAAVEVVVAELERIVHGQLIGWLDEPVPLGATDGSLPGLSSASEALLGNLVIPGDEAGR